MPRWKDPANIIGCVHSNDSPISSPTGPWPYSGKHPLREEDYPHIFFKTLRHRSHVGMDI